MKVCLWPDFNPKDSGEGGIRRVWEALNKHLPEYGVEIVHNMKDADVVNVHADFIDTKGTPLAYSLHGLYWAGYDWPRWAIEANAKLIKAIRYAHAMSVPSDFVHNVFARGALLNPFTLLHGVELDEWGPADNLGYVFWGKTRLDPICDATPVNKLAALCPEQSFVSTFGDENVPNLRLTGHLTYERSKAILSHAAVYLATVKETGGITVLEALASGIPALGFNWGVNPEIIVHKETGYLVDPYDYEALKEGLYYCIENRERLGANAREFIREKHQWRDRVADYIPFYESAIALAQPHTKPTVSVIVTAYNLDQYLPACLDSVISQDYDDWECIVVEDNSPDRCKEIADVYARRDNRIKVIHNSENQYLSEARNIGIRNSSGKYIIPLDADDELGDHALSLLAHSLDQNSEIDIVTGTFELIEPDGSHWVSTWPPKNPTYNAQIAYRNQVPYASMYRRWVWERTGGYRRRWRSAEDAEFWTRAMSFGAVPDHVTDTPTLVYNNRPNSMSHSLPTPNWTAWFPWAYVPETTPFAASGTPLGDANAWPVLDYDPTLISVIIPCGPEHDIFLQDALDSVVAQTFQQWEVIVVNDTGKKWLNEDGEIINPYLKGYPFAKILDCATVGHSDGPAYSRNRGIEISCAPVFVLLDADDYLQPLALTYMLAAYKERGGWIFTDFLDEQNNYKETKDFVWEEALIKMPCPITGLYAKADWDKIDGFDTNITFWEDYDFLLSLMEIGRCGTRLQYPAFTYRYDRGNRRNWTHSNAKEALHEIHQKHYDLIFNDKCKEEGELPSL